MRNHREIPEHVKRLFWDVRKEEIDLHLHCPYIISRIIDYGNGEDVKWMLKTYKQKQIVEVLKRRRGISRKSAIFWSIFFQIPQEEIECLKMPCR